MVSKDNVLKLEVGDAYKQDVGRQIARISTKVMRALGLEVGHVVSILGPKGESAQLVWRLRGDDEDGEVIRIDALTRKNIGASLGDGVEVKPVKIVEAQSVTVSPVEEVRFSGNPEYFFMERIIGKPFVKGNMFEVNFLGNSFYFIVSHTEPKGAVIVTENTQVKYSDSPVKQAQLQIPKITYEDIGGLSNEIAKIREMIELPLKHPEVFEHLGVGAPKGVLLYGPPGTGKTLLAKAVANEADAHFISIAGPEIMSKFYGESEKQLRDIFQQAEKNAPSIIFIDEIDSIAPKREEVSGEVERRVVSQLLTMMDGLKGRGQVIVIGATNRPNALDPALRRPGRFDREIEIGVPDKRGRREIFTIHTRGMPLDKSVDLDKLSEITYGYTGADVEILTKEAALKALRKYIPEIQKATGKVPSEILTKLKVSMEHFMNAYREMQPSALREVAIQKPNVHWADIGGLEGVKQELIEVVEWPLKYPEDFSKLGISPPKGVLLFGVPGTGKTLLAKAVATESDANFISVKGPELLSKWVGESEKGIREIFKKARQVAPCIIFFDEFDSIAQERGGESGDSRVGERVVDQLLTELDGIGNLNGVMVIAATNRPDLVDAALLRPGRLDRSVEVPMPEEKERLEILRVHTKNMPLSKNVNLNNLAKETHGFSGADLAALAREAAMLVLREARMKGKKIEFVSKEDFHEALDKIRKTKGRMVPKAPEEG